MEFAWSGAQQALHERMRAAGKDAQAADPDARLEVLARAGALGLCIDGRYGGGGHDLVTTAHAYEGLGAGLDDAGALLAAGAHLFGVACTVQKVGREQQRARWLPALAEGRVLATVAATEEGAGSNIAEIEAACVHTGDKIVCRGPKRFVTAADRAGLFLFVGRHNARGLSVALVPAGEGVSVGQRYATIGLENARLAPVDFDAVIDGDAMLGRPGAGMAVFQAAMTFERALVLAFRLGAMQRSLDEAVAFARSRRIGGKPISEHQTAAHRIARMKLRLESARLLVYRAAWKLDRGERAHSDAALAKWHLADAAVTSSLDALALRGGSGFLAESGLAGDLHDALGGSIHSGTPEVLADIVAGWLL